MSLRVAGREIRRVLIVDDDQQARDAYQYNIEELKLEPVQEVGPIVNMEKFLANAAAKADAILCDYHLKKRSYATVDGDEIVVRSYKRGLPAVLCTTFTDADNTLLRGYRRYIPALLRPDTLTPASIAEGFERCILEFGNRWQPSRKPWRALVRVEEVVKGEEYFYVVIPGWNPKEKIRLSVNDLTDPMRRLLAPGRRFHAQVNLGAENYEELYFDSWESE